MDRKQVDFGREKEVFPLVLIQVKSAAKRTVFDLKNKREKTFLPFKTQLFHIQVVRYAASEFVLLLRAGAMFSVEHSGLSVYSVFVRGRLRRPVVSLRNPGRILSDTALRGPRFAGVAVGEGPGSGGDRIKNSTTGIIFIKNNYLC